MRLMDITAAIILLIIGMAIQSRWHVFSDEKRNTIVTAQEEPPKKIISEIEWDNLPAAP
jgi:hypothetical protein